MSEFVLDSEAGKNEDSDCDIQEKSPKAQQEDPTLTFDLILHTLTWLEDWFEDQDIDLMTAHFPSKQDIEMTSEKVLL